MVVCYQLVQVGISEKQRKSWLNSYPPPQAQMRDADSGMKKSGRIKISLSGDEAVLIGDKASRRAPE